LWKSQRDTQGSGRPQVLYLHRLLLLDGNYHRAKGSNVVAIRTPGMCAVAMIELGELCCNAYAVKRAAVT